MLPPSNAPAVMKTRFYDSRGDAHPRSLRASRLRPARSTRACAPPHLGAAGDFTVPARAHSTIETWLILPVVIRLSQRLSHACLSISTYTVKLRMAHYISYSLFDSPYYLDNRSNSRANTCTKSRPYGNDVFIRYKPAPHGSLVNHNN